MRTTRCHRALVGCCFVLGTVWSARCESTMPSFDLGMVLAEIEAALEDGDPIRALEVRETLLEALDALGGRASRLSEELRERCRRFALECEAQMRDLFIDYVIRSAAAARDLLRCEDFQGAHDLAWGASYVWAAVEPTPNLEIDYLLEQAKTGLRPVGN